MAGLSGNSEDAFMVKCLTTGVLVRMRFAFAGLHPREAAQAVVELKYWA